MTCLNLGELNGPLILFGGPYSNYAATAALKKIADAAKIPASNIICTGDIVAYFAQPNETVSCIRDWGIPVLMGNCEESLGWSSNDCGCGFEKGTACDLLSNGWYPFANRELREEHRAWMRDLPRSIRFSYHGKQFVVVHGNYEKINQFVFASSPESIKQTSMNGAQVDGIVAGHCGLPFTQVLGQQLWHNPGVIGMPANDGTKRTWYSVWDIVDNGISIKHAALNYRHQDSASEMVKMGTSSPYLASLSTGLWPSMDVLPEQEQTQRGIALQETTIQF